MEHLQGRQVGLVGLRRPRTGARRSDVVVAASWDDDPHRLCNRCLGIPPRASHPGALLDPAAVAEVEQRRLPGCRWKAQNKHSGKVYFDLEPTRQPSRMNTLRVLRVLRWVARAKQVDSPQRS